MKREWTDEADAEILRMLSQGQTRRQIAVHFGVTRNAICGRVYRMCRHTRPAMTEEKPPAPPEPVEFKLGQRVMVDNVRAFVNGERRFTDWSGTGTIDMIQYGGDYIRVVEEPHYAWVKRAHFDRVKIAAV